MKNPFSVNKSYRIRHRILEVLYKDYKAHQKEEGRRVGSIQIESETNISIGDIHSWQYPLVEKGEVTISDNDGQSMISITNNGISAYVDQRYLKEGRRDRWDGIWNWARIVIPLGALLLSAINYYSNRSLSERIENIETQIKQITSKK